MTRRYRFGFFAAACILLALAMAGCERKSINDIKADPGRYSNHEVVIAGNVVRSVSVLGKGVYEIDDGTGKLWIVSQTGVPRNGAQVLVKGTVRDGYNLSEFVKLPEPVSSGLVMIEKSHKAR
jgi:putative cofactor-binding repeat protein